MPEADYYSDADPVDEAGLILQEVKFISHKVRSWSSPPSDSVAGAWGPLLLEKLGRLEESLKDYVAHRKKVLQPPVQTATWAHGAGSMPLAELEKRAILETLKQTSGNREHAARILQIGARTLYRKLKEYGLC